MRIKVDAIGQTMGSGRFTGCNEEAVFSLTKRLKEKKKKIKTNMKVSTCFYLIAFEVCFLQTMALMSLLKY